MIRNTAYVLVSGKVTLLAIHIQMWKQHTKDGTEAGKHMSKALISNCTLNASKGMQIFFACYCFLQPLVANRHFVHVFAFFHHVFFFAALIPRLGLKLIRYLEL